VEDPEDAVDDRAMALASVEARSCDCYFVVRDEYDRLLGEARAGPETPAARPSPIMTSSPDE
jgi:hypothetical protein